MHLSREIKFGHPLKNSGLSLFVKRERGLFRPFDIPLRDMKAMVEYHRLRVTVTFFTLSSRGLIGLLSTVSISLHPNTIRDHQRHKC